MEKMRINNSIKKDAWEEFVGNHQKGNIFQTPEMYEVYKNTKRYEPIALAVTDESDNIQALLLAHVIREFDGFLGSFSSLSIIQGGPLYIEDEKGISTIKRLMEGHNGIVRKYSLYSEIRNLWDSSHISSLLRDIGYTYEEHLNFLIDLTKSVDELWKQLYKSKRQAINKAKRHGVIVEEIKNKELIPIFYALVKKSYRPTGVPIADIGLFENAFDLLIPKDMCKFFLARYKDNYVAATCFLSYNGVIYDWYGGVDRAFSNYRPNELLEWHTIKWGAENGYHIFDFGGAGRPGEPYGPRQFKKEFGGKLVNYGRYKKVHSLTKFKIAMTGYTLYRRVARWVI
jgi:lipid II:glycine glycyltransferase (peptidoglycan interpeptide bridge formation enzyme)